MTGATTTTATTTLSEQDKELFVEGYKIMGADNLQDIVHLCFQDDVQKLPALQNYLGAHKDELERDYTPSQFFDEMAALYHQTFHPPSPSQNQPSPDRTLRWWIQWQKHLMNTHQLPVEQQMKLCKVQFDFRSDGDDDWDTNMYGWDTRRAT
mmetsp:Transcript_1794/g.3950  ORF Transcript_1794/g.3950 Transcript_1794/m.3950 type:complete len:152 (+) Transcript_1794:15-470(+)